MLECAMRVRSEGDGRIGEIASEAIEAAAELGL
jgi:hypothetical protein